MVRKYSALYITYSHVSDGMIRAVTANWCLIVMTREDTPAALIVYPTLGRCHQHVAQCCETFSRPSGIQIVCLGYFWFHRNVD